MNLIKKYKEVIAVILIVLILVFFRSSGLNHFKPDAKKWAEASVTQTNTITIEQAGSLSGRNLIISLDKDLSPVSKLAGDIQYIPADSVLNEIHLTTIMKHEGKVLLYSSETGLSARIWMILSQMGFRNIYILTDRSDNEVLKFNFQPDSLSSGIKK